MNIPDAIRAEVVVTDGWKVLKRAIPRGEAKIIAGFLKVSAQTVRAWKRRPQSRDVLATGRQSPLDLILLLINWLYARNPQGAEMIVDRINSEIATLRQRHGHAPAPSPAEVEGELREISRQTIRLANAMAGTKK